MAVAAACLYAELIGVMHALREFLEGGVHLVAGGAELVGLRHFKAADEAARKRDADNECDQPPGRYTEQKPALRTPPQPGRKPSPRRLG